MNKKEITRTQTKKNLQALWSVGIFIGALILILIIFGVLTSPINEGVKGFIQSFGILISSFLILVSAGITSMTNMHSTEINELQKKDEEEKKDKLIEEYIKFNISYIKRQYILFECEIRETKNKNLLNEYILNNLNLLVNKIQRLEEDKEVVFKFNEKNLKEQFAYIMNVTNLNLLIYTKEKISIEERNELLFESILLIKKPIDEIIMEF